MEEHFIEEISLADDYLLAIGRLMVNWNQLNALFDLLLIKLMGCRIWDVRSHMVIVGMNFGNKVELVKSLAALQYQQDDEFYRKLINDTIPRISELQGIRNAVAHFKWLVEGGLVRGLRMSAKGKLKITDDHVPIEKITKASADMLLMMNEVVGLLPPKEFLERFAT